MSRTREIQEKLNLQAELQLSFSNTKSKVAKWLEQTTDEKKDHTKEETDLRELQDSKKAFFQLPVVQIGSGLNFALEDDNQSKDDIHTIGEFIASDKKISSLSKKKKRVEQSDVRNNMYRIAKDDTRAMVALKRKMRKDQRENIRTGPKQVKKETRTGETGSSRTTTPQANNDEDSEDSDNDDAPIQRTAKKSFGLLFDNNKKRRK
ncbi:hypothetical protein NCAS_0E03910 [Naumovozyma castellii]|uniref:Nucleolar protein 19 n=1 Tax=Naumovozyma castellii TaxID=27288 RepID=G0VG42_NAUCA|nr:hypothetical protein NCAS_0E03910 [Naumovozyma castellii CBS 4309]CCC70461.1 hypothetical protein NCAS_0E03910 [Naumovozyma castellii CBS 4309]